ncbi:carbohydrate sulfotransferase 9-like isoform X2 [Argonauta hians]
MSNGYLFNRDQKIRDLPNASNTSTSKIISDRQKKLKETMYLTCGNDSSKYYGYENQRIFRNHIYFNTRHQYVHCLIEKVACSFFKRFLYFFSTNSHNLKDPFEISLGQSHGLPNERFSQISDSQINKVLENYKKIIFVREPYSRLLTGFVDKLYTRSSRWQKMLKEIYYESNPYRLEKKCYNDVTFSEFVTYFVKRMTAGHYVDGHFMTMYSHCKPCLIKYDFIGKLEYFESDARYMMNLIGLTNHTNIIQKAKSASISDELEDAVHVLFVSDRNLKNPCYNSYESARRIWSKLQLKGIISIHVDFPYSSQNWFNVTKQEFSASLIEKHYLSKNTDRHLSKNRILALREAYHDIPIDTKLKLKKIFTPDCLLFDYNPSPSFVFGKSPIENTFKFFD